MKTCKHAMVPAGAALLAILIGGVTATGRAQTPKPPAKMPQHQETMKGMQGMSGMMGGPHHVLAMAYRDNVATFARALRGEGPQSKAVNLDLAALESEVNGRVPDPLKVSEHASAILKRCAEMSARPAKAKAKPHQID